MKKILLLTAAMLVSTVALASASKGEKVNSISATDNLIASMGRTEKNAGGSLRFAYPGVSFFINFEGKTLSLEASSNNSQSYIEVIVDKGEPQIFKLASTVEPLLLVNATANKKHSVEIIHRSETWHGIVTLKQFSTDGKFITPPQLPQRKILVLGDSVTCGEAIDRVASAKKDTSWWNPRLSYGMLTAKALNAQVQLVCMGGHGLIRTWDGKTNEQNLPDYYQYAIADTTHPTPWNQTRYAPDLIISAIGTNDFSSGIPDREIYVTAYVKFLLRLLTDHKHAQIVLTESAILEGDRKAALIEYFAEILKRTSDTRVHIATATHYPGDKTDAHPTKEQHAAMANELIQQTKKIMHW
jgi:lysophospholipase L1-like esterase